MTDWENYSAYRGLIENAKREERERILALLEQIDSEEDLCGIDYAIALIKGEE